MRRRLPRLALVLSLLLGMLVLPRAVLACSCMQDPDPFADMGPDSAVLIGTTVRAQGPGGSTVAVQAWFGGPPPAPEIVVVEGDGMCNAGAPPPGAPYLLSTQRMPDGRYTQWLCSAVAALDSPDGQRLLAQATRTLGPPIPVGSAGPSDPPSQPVPVIELVALGVLALGAGLGLLAAAAAILGRRRET